MHFLIKQMRFNEASVASQKVLVYSLMILTRLHILLRSYKPDG
jgi:hypothetical protein